MVIVRLIGGLGNQMFQYALGRALAHLNRTTLKLDISAFDTYKLQKYGLDNFRITASVASHDEIKKLVGRTGRGAGVWALRNLMRSYYRRSVVRERQFHFDANILRAGPNVYLKGYWQTEKYFKAVEELLRKEFTVRHPPDAQNQKIGAEVRGTNSVALHVRRGDYVTDPSTNRIHGTCSIAYYNEAVETIARKISGPHFFVFTDDFVWAKENLKFDFPITYATGNGPENSYEDLRLMSLCKHNIVANSSFSWWGAWLNQNPAKIIIAPTHWFDRYAADTRDLLPESWIKL